MKKLLLTIKELKKTAYHHYGEGFLGLLKFLYYSVINVNTFILVGTELDRELPRYDLDPEFRIIKPTLQELSRLREGKDLPREFYYDQIHGVKTCYLVLKGDEIAYIHWVYFRGDHNRFLVLSPGVAELNYNTTLPTFRGKGLMGIMVAYISRDLQKQGYKKVVGLTHEKNIASIKSVERAGWREMKRVKTWGPFNRKIKV